MGHCVLLAGDDSEWVRVEQHQHPGA